MLKRSKNLFPKILLTENFLCGSLKMLQTQYSVCDNLASSFNLISTHFMVIADRILKITVKD